MLPLCNWIHFVSVVGISLNCNSFHCLLAFRPSSPRVQNTRNLKQGVIIILLHTLTLLAQAECFHTVLLSISASWRLRSFRFTERSAGFLLFCHCLKLPDAEQQSLICWVSIWARSIFGNAIITGDGTFYISCPLDIKYLAPCHLTRK